MGSVNHFYLSTLIFLDPPSTLSLCPPSNVSNSLPLLSSRPGRPPKRASIGLSLAASHLSHQLKKHRLENGDYPGYENGHLSGEFRIYDFLP